MHGRSIHEALLSTLKHLRRTGNMGCGLRLPGMILTRSPVGGLRSAFTPIRHLIFKPVVFLAKGRPFVLLNQSNSRDLEKLRRVGLEHNLLCERAPGPA